MATLRQFGDDMAKLTDKELIDYQDALNTLKGWELFEKSFGSSNALACLRHMVSYEVTERLVNKTAIMTRAFDDSDIDKPSVLGGRERSFEKWSV